MGRKEERFPIVKRVFLSLFKSFKGVWGNFFKSSPIVLPQNSHFTGLIFQNLSAYSRMERSAAKCPEAAVFRSAMRVQL